MAPAGTALAEVGTPAHEAAPAGEAIGGAAVGSKVDDSGAVTAFLQKGQATCRPPHSWSTSMGCEHAGQRN